MAEAILEAWQLAAALSEAGRREEAIASWREIVRRVPDDAGAHINLGTALCQTGQYEAAVTAYRTARRLAPDDADSHFGSGVALSKAGQPEVALWHWREAVRLAPHHIDARDNLGHALYHRGEYGAAIEQWREITRLAPGDWQAYSALGSAYVCQAQGSRARKDWRAAWDAYKQAVQFNPQQDAEVLSWVGILEWKFGHRRSAARIMKEALAADPDNQWAYGELARMQFLLGHWRDSQQTALAAMERPSYDPAVCQICIRRAAGALAALALLSAGIILWTRKRRQGK